MKQFYLLLSMLFLAVSASAQVVYVNAAATGGNNGATWADAFTDLTAAIDAASSGDAIWIAAGTYTPAADTSFTITKDLTIIGGFDGTETSADQADLVTNLTLLSGDIAGDDDPNDIQVNRGDNVRVMYVDSLLTGVTISNLAFAGGQMGATPAEAPSIRPFSGGAILAFSPIAVTDCLFGSNFADFGAAVAMFGAGAAGSTIDNSTFIGNVAISRGAIGIFSDGVSVTNSVLTNNVGQYGAIYSQALLTTIDNCELSENTALNRGAAVGLLFAAGSVISNCTITNNQVAAGGAGGSVYIAAVDGADDPNDYIIDNCLIEGNVSAGTIGGGFFLIDANITVRNTILRANVSASRGGAVWATNNDVEAHRTLVFENCVFEENQTNGGNQLGAAVYIQQAFVMNFDSTSFINNGNVIDAGRGAGVCSLGDFVAGSTRTQEINFSNGLFVGNQSSTQAGAFYIQTPNHFNTLTVTNTEFSGNGSPSIGGAIFTRPGVVASFDNCDVNFNSADDGGFIWALDEEFEPIDRAARSSVKVSNSRFRENSAVTQGGAIDVIGGTDLEVTNSIFFGNLLSGGEDAGAGGAIIINGDSSAQQTVLLVNNTFYDNLAGTLGDDVAVFLPVIIGADDFTTVTLQNNAFVSSVTGSVAIEAGEPTIITDGGNFFTIEPVDFDLNASDILDDEVDVEELFVSVDDFEEADFRLNEGLEGNPLIGNGVAGPNVPETDAAGNERGAIIDIGALQVALPTVAEIIAASEVHNSLETALNAAGLTATLNGEGPFTVFAPTDAAFAAIPADIAALLPLGNNLTNVLLTHVISGLVLSTDITDGLVAPSLAPNTNLSFSISGGTVTVTTGGTSAIVTVADLLASNGVVHVIDAVLVPLIVNVTNIDGAGVEVEFFPNPVQDKMNVQVNDLDIRNMSVSVISMNGQRINQWTLGSGSNLIDFSRVPAGAYTLEINIDGKAYSKQIVKQ